MPVCTWCGLEGDRTAAMTPVVKTSGWKSTKPCGLARLAMVIGIVRRRSAPPSSLDE